MKNYYELLEVNPKASDEIIKKIYKIKIKQNHPDLFQGDEKKKAEEITKEITEAYNILSDPEKRKNYDVELKQTSQINDIEKYQNIINSLKAENEYLKEVILSKDNTINTYLNNTQKINNYQDYYQNISDQNITNNVKDFFNNIKNSQNNINDTNTREYFNSILFDLKQLGVKLAILFIFIIIILLLFWAITGTNIFETFKLRL